MTVYILATVLVGILAAMAQSVGSAKKEAWGVTGELRGRFHVTQPDGPPTANRGTSPEWAVAIALLLITVSALRWRVGTDYVQYAENYPSYVAESWSSFTFLSEPGLRVLARVSSLVYDDYAAMFALAAVMTLSLAVWTIYRSSTAFALSILLFIFTGPWLASFNGVRQYLACALVFAGHRLIIERRFRAYAAVVILAGLFHVSAFVLILLYWVPQRRLSLISAGGMLVAAAFAAEGYGRVLEVVALFRDASVESYATNAYVLEQLSPLRLAVAFAPILLYLVFTEKNRLSRADYFYVNMLVLHALALLASAGSAYIARFAIYSGIFVCLAIPRLLNVQDRRLRQLLTLVTLALYSIYWYIETTSVPALATFNWLFERGD